jgi:hypothetical protein
VQYTDILKIKENNTGFVVNISNLNTQSIDLDMQVLKDKVILEFADYIRSYSSE